MNRRQQRIIHQIEAEIDSVNCSYTHVVYDAGKQCPEAISLHRKQTRLESLLALAKRTFEEIAGI